MPVVITIHLERPEATFAPGDALVGQVTLRCEAPVTLEVPLQLEWHAHGKGDQASESLGTEPLFSGELSAGEERTLPFSLTVPAGAVPYAGTIFRVEHRLRAVAAVEGEPAHRHAEAVAPVRVTPVVAPRAFRVAPLRETAPAASMGCLFQSLGIVVLGGLVVALAVAVPEIAFLAGIGATLAAIGIAAALAVRTRAMAERKVGAVGVALEQEGAASYRETPGSSPLTATVTTASKGATARVRLRVQETATRGIGNDATTYTEALFDETVELGDTDTPGTFRGRLPVPAPGEVPLPFRRGRHRVEWEVFVTVDAPGAPEWLHRYALDVSGG